MTANSEKLLLVNVNQKKTRKKRNKSLRPTQVTQ